MRDDVTTPAPHAGETIRVELGTRSYDIIIGEHLLDAPGGFIASTLPGARCAVVSDANVAALYLDRLNRRGRGDAIDEGAHKHTQHELSCAITQEDAQQAGTVLGSHGRKGQG